jgi:hypothetical protein
MGENAKKTWEWHNVVVGQGYQAKGVIRQPGSSSSYAVTDLSKRSILEVDGDLKNSNDGDISSSKKKKQGKDKVKKEKKKKKHKHNKRRRSRTSGDDDGHDDVVVTKEEDLAVPRYDPLLQYFASLISDTTRTFSVA